MSDERAMIDDAIAEGRINRVPLGVSGIVRKPKVPDAPTRFHPDYLGKGNKVDRHKFLDEIDGDWS